MRAWRQCVWAIMEVQAVSKKYDIHPHTVRRGKKELSIGNIEEGNDIRKAGGCRKKNSNQPHLFVSMTTTFQVLHKA